MTVKTVGLRDRLLTRLDELLALAEAAWQAQGGTGDWYGEDDLRVGLSPLAEFETLAAADAPFIASLSPSLMVPVWTALRDGVRGHRLGNVGDRVLPILVCAVCGDLGCARDRDCSFVRRWADALGVRA